MITTNLVQQHKYSNCYADNGVYTLCIYDISGNSLQAGAMIELSTNSKNEYFMYVDDFDNTINKCGKYWKQLTKKQVASIIDAYDNDNDDFINNIFNDMDNKTYKNITCKTFCKKLGYEYVD